MAPPDIPDPDAPIGDIGSARLRLEEWKSRADQMAADTQTMVERLKTLTVTASDRKGLLTLTVDSGGNLIDITLTQRSQRVQPEVTARAILATLAAAKRELFEQSQAVVQESIGGTGTAAAVSESLRQRLVGDGEPEAEREGWS